MKNLCIFGLCLVVCVAYSQAATLVLEPIATKRDVRNIFKQLSNIDGLEPAPQPEELTEDFGGDKARLARSHSYEHHGHYPQHGGHYGGYGGYYGGHGGYYGGHGHGHGHGHYDHHHHH